MKNKIILGADPGTRNFGICVHKTPGKILYSGLLYNTITDMKSPNLIALSKTITKMLKKYRPSKVVLERFLGRGLKGGLNEMITSNTICVALIAAQLGIEVIFVTAATWKNQLAREGKEIEKIYAYAWKYGISKHRVDSLLLAIWASRNEKPFFKNLTKKLVKELENG